MGTPGSSLEIKLQTSSLEAICWGGLWGGLLLARGFDLGCCGEAAKACQFWDCYPLLLFHGGTNNVRGDPEHIKHECMDPGVVAKGTGTKAVSPQSRQRGKGLEEEWVDLTGQQAVAQLVSIRKICLQDFGSLFDDRELLGRDGIHMTKWGKNVFPDMLANLVRRSFKLEVMGERDHDL